LDFSELKRRLKAEQKAKEKLEKDRQKAEADAAANANKPESSKAKDKVNEEEISPNVRHKLRCVLIYKSFEHPDYKKGSQSSLESLPATKNMCR
jgi:lysyl-tRNA synthetase class 2